MSLEIEITREGAREFKAWPQNPGDHFRGVVGEGETPREATISLFDELGRTSFKSWTGERQEDRAEMRETRKEMREGSGGGLLGC